MSKLKNIVAKHLVNIIKVGTSYPNQRAQQLMGIKSINNYALVVHSGTDFFPIGVSYFPTTLDSQKAHHLSHLSHLLYHWETLTQSSKN